MKTIYRFLNNSAADGFSLAELLVVCSITFVLLAVAIPGIYQTLSAYRLETASSMVSARLLEARLTAVKHNRSASFRVNSSERTLEVWTTDPGGDPIRVGIVAPIPSHIVVDPAFASQVDFSSLGRNQAVSSTLKLSLSGTGLCKTITTSAIGNITVTNGC